MIGVVIPAHNEAEMIGKCLQSVGVASRHAALRGEKVLIVVVADGCHDNTESVAVSSGALVLSVHKRNVGGARSLGAQLAITHGARWLAFTDADTVVPADWLVQQLACATDAVCGVVTVSNWAAHSKNVKDEFYSTYRDIEGHRHIHGANLGVSASAYEKAGGFQPLAYDEDVALVDALVATGAALAWTNKVRVDTSARREARVPWGFGATLQAASSRLDVESTDLAVAVTPTT